MLVSSEIHPKTLDFFQKTSDIILISWEVFSNTSDLISSQCDKLHFTSLIPLKSMPWESHNRPQRETIFIDRVKFDISQRKHFKIIAIQQKQFSSNQEYGWNPTMNFSRIVWVRRELLWEEGASVTPATETASVNVPTPSATQGGMTGGSASNQRNFQREYWLEGLPSEKEIRPPYWWAMRIGETW